MSPSIFSDVNMLIEDQPQNKDFQDSYKDQGKHQPRGRRTPVQGEAPSWCATPPLRLVMPLSFFSKDVDAAWSKTTWISTWTSISRSPLCSKGSASSSSPPGFATNATGMHGQFFQFTRTNPGPRRRRGRRPRGGLVQVLRPCASGHDSRHGVRRTRPPGGLPAHVGGVWPAAPGGG